MSPSGPGTVPLVWLHGFTQTSQSAYRFRTILAADREVVALDLPGHGANWSIDGNLDEVAQFVLSMLPPGRCDLAGYSFGARVGLHVALAEPTRFAHLVVLGATRGIEDDLARQERRERDDQLADHIDAIGAPAFVDEWLRQPMFAQLPDEPKERATRSLEHAEGLSNSLRHCGTGTQRFLGDALSQLDVPTLALAGAADERFAREAHLMASSMPRAVAMMVPGANHAAHLHQPQWCANLVRSFCSDSVDRHAVNDQEDAQG
jgi:2-succinyl-6-hydroxy-2,4-cyclohexadiene-1-carboxylate synthase